MRDDVAGRRPVLAFPADRLRIATLRLAAQRLGATRAASPTEAARWMLAVQAQDLPGAKWSLGLRTHGGTEQAVDAALDAGEVVRSWPLRGTLHLVAAEDLPWILALTGARQANRAAPRRRALRITDPDIARAEEAARTALQGRRALTRGELLARMRDAGVVTDGQRGYHLIGHLARAGTLVMGATQGREQTFALLDEWVPIPPAIDRDEALGRLAVRYLRSHGPASDADLARWAGITLGDARRGRAICGAALATIEVGGTTYHLDAEALDHGPTALPPPTRVLLLPGFDEYVLGYRDRSTVLAREHADRVVPGGNGMFRPTIVVDGMVVGTWSRKVRADGILVTPELFGNLDAGALADLADAVGRLGSFLGRDARLAPVESSGPGAAS